MKAVRTWLIWLTAALVLASVNIQIARKEALLKNGALVYLELAPVDPRSLIQGDYMRLAYRAAREAPRENLPDKGRLILRLDERKVGHFVRLDDGSPIGPNEIALVFRLRGGRLRLGAESFFFQEGLAGRYARARYGMLRVAPSGESVLVDLRGENFDILADPPQ